MRNWIVIAVAAGCPSLFAGSFVINQPADSVLGQADLVSSKVPSIPNAASMDGPFGVAIDPTTGKVFVADQDNNRVLRFASTAAITAGQPAEAVLGQPDFISKGHAATATGMYFPSGLAVDGFGTLWVGDIQNNRILRFANASTKASGAAADGVLGQPDFVSSGTTFPATAASVGSVYSLTVNSTGTLWAADTNDNRVLRYDFASAKANGANADAVLGQVDFTTTADTPVNGTTMASPIGVAIDGSDNLWVADSGNNRVLRFSHATFKPVMGAPADAVIGQPIFTTSYISTTRYGLFSPSGVGVDSNGTLWVATFYDNRVLGYSQATSLSNGPLADVVLGQPAFDYAIRYLPVRPYSFAGPRQIAPDTAGNFWIADSGDNRVLHFSPQSTAVPPTTSSGSPPSISVAGSHAMKTSQSTVSLRGTAAGAAGVAKVEYRIGSGAFHRAGGTSSWKIKVKLPPGKTTLFVRAVDTLGRTSPAVKITVTRK